MNASQKYHEALKEIEALKREIEQLKQVGRPRPSARRSRQEEGQDA